MEPERLTLADFAKTSESGEPLYTPYGYIIDAQARIHALLTQYCHGVVLALLYPEVAASAGFEPPCHPREELPVLHYQRFEFDHCDELPVLRVACRYGGGVYVSHGPTAQLTDAQHDALRRVFKALGLRGTDTLTGEEEDTLTVNKFLEHLRQERDNPRTDYSLTPPDEM